MRLVPIATKRLIWGLLASSLLAALAIAFIMVAVRPFDDLPESAGDDVAIEWNASMSRLGIVPVFPPVEDLHVGDLWAIVTEGNKDAPLLRKSVRLTHIDLRDVLQAEHVGQPVFPDTATADVNGEAHIQPSSEVARAKPADPISLTLTAFPGISIRHGRYVTGSIGARLLGFRAVRDALSSEDIRIPVAETYGVNAAMAIARLTTWCKEPDTQIYCTDGFVRRVLAFSVSDQVLATSNGRYVFRLQLCLVTRVFLMREIEYRNLQQGSIDTSASAETPPVSPSLGSLTGAGKVAQERRTDVALRQVFQRPLVFGFRSVNIALPLASPSKDNPP
jgi:hypothetical protein